ncbi:uncharacterized protein LOC141909543 [Tubulanus polymorphus]|uniref:uncharacterized protein LOC141909543 n=1 Tax=Tubulanus polymorphus TaxID=672921 RepID=UPI003DA49620
MLPNISEEYKAKSNLNFDLTDSKIVENTVASTEVLEEGPVCPKSRSSSSSKYPSRSEFDTANCEKGCNSNVENQSAPNLKLDMRKIGNSSEIPTCSKGLESQISGKPDSKPSCVEKIFVREQPILLSNLTTGIGAKPSALGTAAPSMAKIQRDVIASFLNKIAPSYDGRGDEPARLNTTGAGKVKQDRPRLTSDVMFFKNENLNIVSANDAVGRNSNRKRQFVPPTGNNPGILNDDAISKTRVNSEKKVRFSPCNDTQSKAQRKQFTGDDSLFSDDDFNNN